MAIGKSDIALETPIMEMEMIKTCVLCEDADLRQQIAAVAERCHCEPVFSNDTFNAIDQLPHDIALFVAHFRHVEPVHLRFVKKIRQRWPHLRIVVVAQEDRAAAAVSTANVRIFIVLSPLQLTRDMQAPTIPTALRSRRTYPPPLGSVDDSRRHL